MASETNKGIFIYEPRLHKNLEFVIYNHAYFAKGFGLIIFCSKENYSYITNILKHNKFRCILHIVREDTGDSSARNDYNKFTKSAEFWNSLPFEYVLMTEIDAYLRKPLPQLTEYDYVCSEWPWNKKLSGGGGLSFRKVSSMKRIVNEIPNLQEECFPQDYWAALGCYKLNLRCNNLLFVEANHMIEDPIGFHQWWTFVNPRCTQVYENYVTLEL
jgi:hypothetical protein